MKSNKLIEQELVEDPSVNQYIKENNEIIEKSKEEIHKILNAFLKSGINLDKEVMPKLKYKSLYLNEDESFKSHLPTQSEGASSNQNTETSAATSNIQNIESASAD